jgi:hypothetical protein
MGGDRLLATWAVAWSLTCFRRRSSRSDAEIAGSFEPTGMLLIPEARDGCWERCDTDFKSGVLVAVLGAIDTSGRGRRALPEPKAIASNFRNQNLDRGLR